jgi:uncharacterized membrane protein
MIPIFEVGEFRLRPRALAVCYFIFSAIIIGLINTVAPPCAIGPDEFEHSLRVASLSSGQLLPAENSGLNHSIFKMNEYYDDNNAGGKVNDGLLQFLRAVRTVCCGVPGRTLKANEISTADTIARSQDIRWANGSTFALFPVVGQYGPALYVPQAIGLVIGRVAGLSVLNSYLFARTLTGFAAITLASVAIANSEGGAFVMAVVLSTPMYLFLAASLSQDGLLVAAAALFAAMVAKPDSPNGGARNWVAWICGLLITMGRAPYGLLSVLLIRRRQERSLIRWLRAPDGPLAPILILIIAASWLLSVGLVTDPRYNRKAQIAGLLVHPSSILRIAKGTIERGELTKVSHQVIGVLGWINIPLPGWSTVLGWFAIALAAASCIVLMRGRSHLACLTAAIVFLLTLGGIHAAAYIAFNPVGQGFVAGVQGRYLLPCLVGLSLIIPPLVSESRKTKTPVQQAANMGRNPDSSVSQQGYIPKLHSLSVIGGFLAWAIMIIITLNALSVLRGFYGPR